jgi:nicotinamidase-related amidase
MHKIAISPAAIERMTRRMGKLHPFDTMAPRKTALLVIDMQNYFVKPGQQGEIPAAREIVPNINRLAVGLRRRGGHVVWVRNGTRDTRQSWSTLHDFLMTPGAPGAAHGRNGYRRRWLSLLAPQRHSA